MRIIIRTLRASLSDLDRNVWNCEVIKNDVAAESAKMKARMLPSRVCKRKDCIFIDFLFLFFSLFFIFLCNLSNNLQIIWIRISWISRIFTLKINVKSTIFHLFLDFAFIFSNSTSSSISKTCFVKRGSHARDRWDIIQLELSVLPIVSGLPTNWFRWRIDPIVNPLCPPLVLREKLGPSVVIRATASDPIWEFRTICVSSKCKLSVDHTDHTSTVVAPKYQSWYLSPARSI